MGLAASTACNGVVGSASGPKLPNGDYGTAAGDLAIEVDPSAGARLVSLSRAGNNWLTGPAANATNYGSTFWTSPQSDWSWPPPPEIDNQPYAFTGTDRVLAFRGVASSALGVRVDKSFSLGTAPGSVVIDYSLTNVGAAARSFAPWEVTRVRPAGVFFFPTGASAHSAAGTALPTTEQGGVTWFDASAAALRANVKYFADGTRGWLAQAASGMVFVKKFDDVAPADQAPGEAEIELYVNGDGTYIEMEIQGSYAPISPNAPRDWSVRWFLAPIPSSVDASVGSASLVSFVDGL